MPNFTNANLIQSHLTEASARNAQAIMEKKMQNQFECVYYNMCVQRGKSREHDVEELPIEFLTQRYLLMPGERVDE